MTICASIGLKKSLKTIVHFPTIMLTPIFSFWVIGPKGPYSFKTWCCGGSKEIKVSFLHSWMNFFLTIFGHSNSYTRKSIYCKIWKQSNNILWKENNFKSPNTPKFNDFQKFDEVISYTETDRNMFLRIDILQTLQGYQVPVSPLWQYRHHSVRFLIVHFSPDKMVNSQIVWSEHF